jgi:hypothetical protein
MALLYLASPYSRYAAGIDAAFVEACRITASLISRGYSVYSPIAHTHPVALHGALDPLDHSIWLPFNAAMMHASSGLIVSLLPGWDSSTGVQHEIDYFAQAGKPIDRLSWPKGEFKLGVFDKLRREPKP